MIVRPNPLEQLAGGDRHRNYPGPRDFLEDFLEGEGAPTSSLLRWNLKSNPASPNLNPDNSKNSGNFQLRVIPKIPPLQGPHKQPNGPEEEVGHPTGRPQSENRGRALAFYGDITLSIQLLDLFPKYDIFYFLINLYMKSIRP